MNLYRFTFMVKSPRTYSRYEHQIYVLAESVGDAEKAVNAKHKVDRMLSVEYLSNDVIIVGRKGR